MKKLLLFIVAIVASYGTIAQVTFFIEPPSVNVGNYTATYANEGGGTSWTLMPDLSDAANSVTGQLAIVQGVDSIGCDPLTNGADINGKIAVVWRGACEFGTKAFNAQNAGAIGVIIVNHSGDPVGMAAGTDGVNVTIPVVMVSTTTGNLIYNELQNGSMTGFIGNKTGLYANDLGIGSKDVYRAAQFAIPSAIAQNDTEFSVEPGAWVFNYGFEDATNVTLTCEISGSGVSSPYNEVSPAVDIDAGDSAWFSFTPFSQTSYPEAYYNMSYTISSDSVDDFNFDDAVIADFAVTDNVFSYVRVDENATTEPISNSGYFTTASFLTACSHFKNANASRLIAESVTFSATTSTINDQIFLWEVDDQGNENAKSLEVNIYKWSDLVTDINDAAFDISNLEIATEEDTYEYTYTADLQGVNVTQPIDPFLLEDNQSYLFCVTTYDNSVYIGFDTKTDYDETILDHTDVMGGSPSSNGGQPATMFQTEDADGQVQWYGLGRGTDSQAGIGINFVSSDELAVEEVENVKATAFPNPANENVSIMLNDMSGSGFLTVVDLEGKVVLSNTVTIDGSKLTVDVSDLASGMYVFNLNLENGKTSTFNVVVNK